MKIGKFAVQTIGSKDIYVIKPVIFSYLHIFKAEYSRKIKNYKDRWEER
jgi:hypothetical protein